MRSFQLRSLFVIILLFISDSFAQSAAPNVPRFGRWEGVFYNRGRAMLQNPQVDFMVELTSPTGKISRVPGFFYGSDEYRARFSPNEKGKWTFKSIANKAHGLHGHTGEFNCVENGNKDRFSVHGPIQVAKSRTHLEHTDGTPFFWLGDTAWNAATHSTKEEWAVYLKDRTEKHFTGVQCVIHTPWRCAQGLLNGTPAFREVGTHYVPDAKFYQQIDERMNAAADAGILMAPVLIWANAKTDSGNVLPEDKIIQICKYEYARYHAHPIMWILAGDNSYVGAHGDKWKRVGRAVFGDGVSAPVTTHPTGMNWPWETWRQEKWLTVLGYQSGHGDDANTLKWIHSGPPALNRDKEPTRPMINLEPPYEGHNGYQSRKPHSAYNVRRAVYWSLFNAPTAGVTYGGHGVWSWHTQENEEPINHVGTGKAPVWQKGLTLPGSLEMKHVFDLLNSMDWWKLRPLAMEQTSKEPADFIAVAMISGQSLIAYLPKGGEFTIPAAAKLPMHDKTQVEWFDPRTGKRQPAKLQGMKAMAPDNSDWVLLVK